MVWPGEAWVLPGLLAKNTLCMNECLSGFKPRYLEGNSSGAHLNSVPTAKPNYGTDDDDDLCS